MSAAKVIGAIANISGAKMKKKKWLKYKSYYCQGGLGDSNFGEGVTKLDQKKFSKEEAKMKWALLAPFVICIL